MTFGVQNRVLGSKMTRFGVMFRHLETEGSACDYMEHIPGRICPYIRAYGGGDEYMLSRGETE